MLSEKGSLKHEHSTASSCCWAHRSHRGSDHQDQHPCTRRLDRGWMQSYGKLPHVESACCAYYITTQNLARGKRCAAPAVSNAAAHRRRRRAATPATWQSSPAGAARRPAPFRRPAPSLAPWERAPRRPRGRPGFLVLCAVAARSRGRASTAQWLQELIRAFARGGRNTYL